MIELDVYLTRDKQPVVIHDATVDRTTNGSGRVADLTLAGIQRLDAGSWKDPRFAGERVPALRQALEVMPVNLWLNVHLKGGAELARLVAKVLAEQDRLHQAFLACGKEAAEAARAVEPRILIANLERQGGSSEYVDDTIAMKAAFIQLLGEQHPDYPAFTQRLKRHGVRINYCCTDDPAELRAAFAAGVEFPLVDHIQAAVEVAREAGVEPLRPLFRSGAQARTNP
jgi:glycerophosphoryl diester phosphodiesterase